MPARRLVAKSARRYMALAMLLLALPVLLLLAIWVIDAKYVAVLFERPWLLGAMFLFEAIGALWMHRIVKFDF